MHRRSFIKLVGIALGGAAARLPFGFADAAGSTAVAYRGQLYRAGRHGRILVSSNAGKSWKVHTKLGDAFSVGRLSVDSHSRLRATIGFRRREFNLFLANDGHAWLTSGALQVS